MSEFSVGHGRPLLSTAQVSYKKIVPLLLVALLAGCAGRSTEDMPPVEPVPAPAPVPLPTPKAPPVQPAPVPAPPASQPTISPRFAPPPHVAAQWDNRLGVYVVPKRELYYRERVYYQKQGGEWMSSSLPDGPWEPVAAPSVPPGLRSL
ncbi:hypothetical protein [Pseudomonas matsuisoli]|uniref:Lipoprotein n=1 Tax=Pseudomonas matsuisoli TaxID=1515666 RepID=A0A917PIW3_9PSED|nr:hypothetical protein [Pseudomonas matsuisoli]GGJ80164.1 hypothetical protein GCM10009304_02360 [Pseudomonas matsuisoli]